MAESDHVDGFLAFELRDRGFRTIRCGIEWMTIGLTLTRSALEKDLLASPEASSSMVISIKRGKLDTCPESHSA